MYPGVNGNWRTYLYSHACSRYEHNATLNIVLRRLWPQQEKQPECEARWEVGRPKIKVANTAIQDDTEGSGLKVFSRNHRKLIDYLQQTFLPLCHLIFIQK